MATPVTDNLWPEPHDLRFDLAGTATGAEWIDNTARAARAVLAATTLPAVVGPFDWRVQNLGFTRGRVTAIYDWDSVALAPEAAVVGAASVTHPVDWRLGLADPLPTKAQVDDFITAYEQARRTPFDNTERIIIAAAQRWVVSYGARCQHTPMTCSASSPTLTTPKAGPDSCGTSSTPRSNRPGEPPRERLSPNPIAS